MLLLRFFHMENELFVCDKKYKATCPVRNEINKRRNSTDIVKTYPSYSAETRKPYYPRKFPTGFWEVKSPILTNNPELAPVKIPTSAVRTVAVWDIKNGQYNEIVGSQNDGYYHLHWSKPYRTTLGCIRLDSEEDAIEISGMVKECIDSGEKCYIEVMVFKGE